MTLPKYILRIAEYLIEIENMVHEATKNYELNETETKTRKELHKNTQNFLQTLKMGALEKILKEEEEEENGNNS